jgi:hypothetical protein
LPGVRQFSRTPPHLDCVEAQLDEHARENPRFRQQGQQQMLRLNPFRSRARCPTSRELGGSNRLEGVRRETHPASFYPKTLQSGYHSHGIAGDGSATMPPRRHLLKQVHKRPENA